MEKRAVASESQNTTRLASSKTNTATQIQRTHKTGRRSRAFHYYLQAFNVFTIFRKNIV
jgi:hypothetical protein